MIDRVASLQSPHISMPLRNAVHTFRKYRNFLVPPNDAVVNRIIFNDGLACLSRYVDKIADPPY
jgi:hypothetical protein